VPRCSIVVTEIRLLWLRLLVGEVMIFLLSLFLTNGISFITPIFIYILSFNINYLIIFRIIIISRRNKNNSIQSIRRGITREERVIVLETCFVRC